MVFFILLFLSSVQHHKPHMHVSDPWLHGHDYEEHDW